MCPTLSDTHWQRGPGGAFFCNPPPPSFQLFHIIRKRYICHALAMMRMTLHHNFHSSYIIYIRGGKSICKIRKILYRTKVSQHYMYMYMYVCVDILC